MKFLIRNIIKRLEDMKKKGKEIYRDEMSHFCDHMNDIHLNEKHIFKSEAAKGGCC